MKRDTALRFISYIRHFGPRLAWYYFVYPRYGGSKAILRRHEEIKRWLKRKYKPILDKYRDIELPTLTLPDTNRPIWFCWLQGESEMPQLVKLCYQSVLRNAAGRPVHLVTEENLTEFVNVDPKVKQRLDEGKLSRTHFADYLRLCLLATHGGLWLDASLYITEPLSNDICYPFYSIAYPPESIHYVSEYRWVVGCMSVHSAWTKMFEPILDIFKKYIIDESHFVDFFLLDYIIAICADEIPFIEDLITSIPQNNTGFYSLSKIINNTFNKNDWEQICTQASIHRLSWKDKYQVNTQADEKSFWGAIIGNEI